MKPFKAFRIHSEGGKIAARFEDLTLDDLAAGEVVIRVAALRHQLQGRARRHRRGQDPAPLPAGGRHRSRRRGRVLQRCALQAGRCGAGDGLRALRDARRGLCGVRAREGRLGDPDPAGLDARTAMSLGTAGFTAALAIHRMEQNGQTPGRRPDRGHRRHRRRRQHRRRHARDARIRVVAVSGKADAADYLKALGASEVLDAQEPRLREPAARERALRRRHRQRRRRDAHLAHAHRGFLGQHRQHRPGRLAPSSRPP